MNVNSNACEVVLGVLALQEDDVVGLAGHKLGGVDDDGVFREVFERALASVVDLEVLVELMTVSLQRYLPLSRFALPSRRG